MHVHVIQEICTDAAGGLAGEDDLLRAAIQAGEPHLRLWVNAPCIVLGRGYARKLPRTVDSVAGLPVLVRSSGGEIVLHGPGVLNVSLAVPSFLWDGSIEDTFEGLSSSVATALIRLGWPAHVGRIPRSYCPGDHDVAVAGKKVMGMSQRRVRDGVMVHGSLNVSINPGEYAAMLTSFYTAAGIDDRPDVSRIGSLRQGPVFDLVSDPLVAAIGSSMLRTWSRKTGLWWHAADGPVGMIDTV